MDAKAQQIEHGKAADPADPKKAEAAKDAAEVRKGLGKWLLGGMKYGWRVVVKAVKEAVKQGPG